MMQETEPSQADVLVGAHVKGGFHLRRTLKVMVAVCRGLPVVDLSWLRLCKAEGRLVRPEDNLLRDAKAEKDLGFTLQHALTQARAAPLLADYAVVVVSKEGKDACPPSATLEPLVQAAGGVWLGWNPGEAQALKQAGQRQVLVISNEASLKNKALSAKVRTAS